MKPLIDLLASVPAAAYTAGGASLLRAFIALVGVWITNRSSNQRLRLQLQHELAVKRDDARLAHLEELYLLVEKWTKMSFSHDLPYIQVMKGEITYNDALDSAINIGAEMRAEKIDYDRIAMIINIYLPELRSALSELTAGRDQAARILSAHKRKYKTGAFDGEEFVKPLLGAHHQIDEKAKALKEQLFHLAHTPP